MHVRDERPEDHDAIRAVNLAAFESPTEATLVNTLRRQADWTASLVADEGGRIVGHILFSPVTLDGHPPTRLAGLAPMAVLPAHQRHGIGSALVRAGLDRCRAAGIDAVVLVGHPAYYPRFGFVPASRFGLTCDYDVPDEAFMAMELVPGRLAGRPGRVHYHPAFAES